MLPSISPSAINFVFKVYNISIFPCNCPCHPSFVDFFFLNEKAVNDTLEQIMHLVSREGNISELFIFFVATCSVLLLWFSSLCVLGVLQTPGDPWSCICIYEGKTKVINTDTGVGFLC